MTERTGRTNKKGAGRPPTGLPRMVVCNVTLPIEQVAWLEAQGNRSKAVRELIAAAMAAQSV